MFNLRGEHPSSSPSLRFCSRRRAAHAHNDTLQIRRPKGRERSLPQVTPTPPATPSTHDPNIPMPHPLATAKTSEHPRTPTNHQPLPVLPPAKMERGWGVQFYHSDNLRAPFLHLASATLEPPVPDRPHPTPYPPTPTHVLKEPTNAFN